MTTRAIAIRGSRPNRRSRVWTTHQIEATVATDTNILLDSLGNDFDAQMAMEPRGVTLAALRGYGQVYVGAITPPVFGPLAIAVTWAHNSTDADDLQNPLLEQGSWQYYFGANVAAINASAPVSGLPLGAGDCFPIMSDAQRKQPSVNMQPKMFVRHSIGVTVNISLVYRALWLLP